MKHKNKESVQNVYWCVLIGSASYSAVFQKSPLPPADEADVSQN